MGAPDSFGRLAWGPWAWDIILLACPCIIFTMFGNRAATVSRCFLVSGWFSCQPMMVLKAPCMTVSAALLAHCVEKTKIWLLCWRYCWSMLLCCLLITLEGRGCVEEGAGPPGRGPPPKPTPRPPNPKSFPKSQLASNLA